MKWSRMGRKAGVKVRKGRNQSRSSVGADWQTAGDPPGIDLPGMPGYHNACYVIK